MAENTEQYTGSDKARQEVGDPGHCEDCVSRGHVVAHPDLGCGDVGCTAAHGPDDEENTEQYTPDDSHIRDHFIWSATTPDDNLYTDHITSEEAEARWGRFITAHDARVKAEALENPTEGAVLSLAVWMAVSDGEVWVGPLDEDLEETDRDWYLDQAREALEVASNAQKSGVGVKS